MNNSTLTAMQTALAQEIAVDRVEQNSPPAFPSAAADFLFSPPPLAKEIVEDYTRFSESRIWQFQREFFESEGADAWSQGIVPHYVTSNMLIASKYAKVAAAFLRQQTQPTTIVELGTGSGQFSFHFLTCLAELATEGTYKYVITDFTTENLDFCRARPELSGFVAKGKLEFARLDATAPEPFAALAQRGPVIVIANYLFDSIPQDLFEVREGALSACEVQLSRKGMAPSDPLEGLSTSYRKVAVASDYYPEPALNAVLAHYQTEFEAARFLFPHVGMRILEWFRSHSNGQLLLLSGDKGSADPEDLVGAPYPRLVNHGSFSLSVNFHAFKVFAAQNGAVFHATPQKGRTLNVCALQWGEAPAVGAAFAAEMGGFGPNDFFTLKREIEDEMAILRVEGLIAYVRMAAYDPKALLRSLPFLEARRHEFTPQLQANFGELVARVWDNFYGLATELDWGLKTGELLLELGLYALAIRCLDSSAAVYGPKVKVLYASARACIGLQDDAGARQALNACFALSADYPPACKLLRQLNAQAQPA